VFIEGSDIVVWNFDKEKPEDKRIRRKFGASAAGAGGASDPAAISFVGHQRQLEDLLRALKTGGKLLVDGREGRKAVEVILAIYKSAASGKKVRLPLR